MNSKSKLAFKTYLTIAILSFAPASIFGQEEDGSQSNFLKTMVEIEDAIKHLQSEEGSALNAENYSRRNQVVKLWADIYLFQAKWKSLYGQSTNWPLPKATAWWKSDTPILNSDGEDFIKRNHHSGEVKVFDLAVVAGKGEVVKVIKNDDSIVEGLKVSDDDSGVVVKNGDTAQETKVARSDIKNVESLTVQPEEVPSSTQLYNLVGRHGMAKWEKTLKLFAEAPPDWREFTISRRNQVLEQYKLAVDDLKLSVNWKYPFEIEERLEELVRDQMRIPKGKVSDKSEVVGVASGWNALINHLSVPPVPRQGKPDKAGKPTELPKYSSDEVAGNLRQALSALKSKLSSLGTGEEVVTDLEPLIDRVFYLHGFRSAVDLNEASPMVKEFDVETAKFIELFSKHAAIGPDSTEAFVASQNELNSHWKAMQKKVARAALLRHRIELCQEQRHRLVSMVYHAVENNRTPLVESCAVQLGKKLKSTISKWDADHNQKRFSWDKSLWMNQGEMLTRKKHRDLFALSLGEAIGGADPPLNSESLLSERVPSVLDREFPPRETFLDDMIGRFTQQLEGKLPEDSPVKLQAIAHRVRLNSNEGSKKWHFQNVSKQCQTLTLFAHELEFAEDLILELEDGCHVFLVLHRLVGESAPTIILKGSSSFNVFCSEIPKNSKSGFVVGEGRFTMIAGASDVKKEGNAPHAAWEWLAGQTPALKKAVSKFWLEIWNFYVERFLENNGIDARASQIVYLDLLDLPKTTFAGISVETDAKSEIEAAIKDFRQKRFRGGSIEHVIDKKTGRFVPVFLNSKLLEGDGTVFLLPDQLVLLPDKKTGKLGSWEAVGQDTRQLKFQVKAVSSLFARQHNLELLRNTFGRNVEVVAIEQSPDYQVAFKAGGTELHVASDGAATDGEGTSIEMREMDFKQIIETWLAWSDGKFPSVNLVVQEKNANDKFVDVSGYDLKLEFRPEEPPTVSVVNDSGQISIKNESELDVRVEYAIDEPHLVCHELNNTPLGPKASFVPNVSFSEKSTLVSATLDISAIEPFEMFSMRKPMRQIETQMIDLGGLIGARFPNASLQPGNGIMVDHSKSTIHFESKRQKNKDIDGKWKKNDLCFSGTWADYFSRGNGDKQAARYSFIMNREDEIRLVVECVPYYGSTFVSPDEKYRLVFNLAAERDKQNLRKVDRKWFERQIKKQISAGNEAGASN